MLRVTTLRIGSCRAPAFAAGLPDRGKVMLPALATLIETNTQTLLFDCGYGASFYDATDRFPARAYRIATPMTLPPQERLTAQLNRPPDLVILSHMHGDHVAGLLDLPDDIPVLASKEAIDHLSGLSSALTATLAACPPLLRDGVLARDPRPIDERRKAVCVNTRIAQTGFDNGNGFNIQLAAPERRIDRFEIGAQPVSCRLHDPENTDIGQGGIPDLLRALESQTLLRDQMF